MHADSFTMEEKAETVFEKPNTMETKTDQIGCQQSPTTITQKDSIELVETNQSSLAPALDSSMKMKVSNARGIAMIVTLAGMNFLNTMGSGILIAALPKIASDINIPEGLILWYVLQLLLI